MKQRALAGFEKYGKVARRAQFLADMDQVMSWDKLVGLIRPHYPTMGEQGGRPAVPAGAYAPGVLPATVVQPVGSGRRRGVVRLGHHAPLCGRGLGLRRPPDETTFDPALPLEPELELRTYQHYGCQLLGER